MIRKFRERVALVVAPWLKPQPFWTPWASNNTTSTAGSACSITYTNGPR